MSVPPSGPSPAAQAVITADKVMDFLPGASTLSNGVILITKLALELLNLVCHSAYESIKDYSLVKHVEDKHGFVCIMLSIPFLNTIVAYFYHTVGLKQASHDEYPSPLQPSVLQQNNSFFTASRPTPAPQNGGFNNSFSNLWKRSDDTQQYQNSKQQFQDDMQQFRDDMQKFSDDLLDPIAQARTQQQLKLAKASYKQYLSNLPQQQQISQQRHQQIIDQAIRTQSDIDDHNKKMQAIAQGSFVEALEEDSLVLDDQEQDQSDSLDAPTVPDQSNLPTSVAVPSSQVQDDMQQTQNSANAAIQQPVDDPKQQVIDAKQRSQARYKKTEQDLLDQIAAATDINKRKNLESAYEKLKKLNQNAIDSFDRISQAQNNVTSSLSYRSTAN